MKSPPANPGRFKALMRDRFTEVALALVKKALGEKVVRKIGTDITAAEPFEAAHQNATLSLSREDWVTDRGYDLRRCQCRLKIPQKCWTKNPHFGGFGDQPVQRSGLLFLGGRPRRFGFGGGAIGALARTCSGMRSA